MYQRDVGVPLQIVRALLLGRTWNTQNRFQQQLSPRPYPKPELTGGVAHKSAENYYYERDARRAVKMNQDLPTKLVTDGKSTTTSGLPPSPGHSYRWD